MLRYAWSSVRKTTKLGRVAAWVSLGPANVARPRININSAPIAISGRRGRVAFAGSPFMLMASSHFSILVSEPLVNHSALVRFDRHPRHFARQQPECRS